MIRNMVMEFIPGLMAKFMMGIGRMANSMALDALFLKIRVK